MPEAAAPSKPLATSKPNDPGQTADGKDRYGEWLADDARIWREYERLAKLDDDEKVKRWSGGLNNLALFATLFAGITTAFIIESQGDLKPDFAELAYRVQNATAHGRAYVEEPFVVPGQARTVNCLWIASLILSLSAAPISVMGQDWVEMYVDKPVCNPRQWAEIRCFRLNGVHRWRMPGVIATAPVLLHASLFLFGIGLAVFMAPDAATQSLCIVLCAIVALLYAFIMISPVLWSSSPFRSPATMLVREWFCATFQRGADTNTALSENAAIRFVTRCCAAAHSWISTCLSENAAIRCVTRSGASARGFIMSYLSMAWGVFDLIVETFGAYVSKGRMVVFRRRPLQPSWTTHDVGTPDVAAESQDAAAGSAYSIPARFGRPALAWIKNCPTNFRTVSGRIVGNSRPDFSNGWSDIPERRSPALMADSLSWLSSASSSPEVTQLVVAGLCDHIIGPQVAEHAYAQRLRQRLSQYADGHWEHMSMLDLCRYVIISAHAGQEDWPDGVKERFKGLIDADTALPQDFLLALVYLTSGFRHEPLPLMIPIALINRIRFGQREFVKRVNAFARLCERIQHCNPIALSTMASILTRLTMEPERGGSAMIILVLINKWRDALPPDLGPLETTLHEVLPKEAVEHVNKLLPLCSSSLDSPVDKILHMSIAFFSISYEKGFANQSMRNFALSLAQATSTSSDWNHHHSCLAFMFGNRDHRITDTAWSDLPAHDVELAIHQTCSYMLVNMCHANLQPMLARMMARCISPPFRLLAGDISAQTLLSRGELLFSLVDAMSKDHALPDDLFRPVLESGALANLAAFLCKTPSGSVCSSDFLYILGAISQWITAHSNLEDQRRLFELFTWSQTTSTLDDAVWDMVNAIEIVLETTDDQSLETYRFYIAMEKFMSVIPGLRGIFPGPKCTLWESIARTFGANEHRFGQNCWATMCKLIELGTGINPERFEIEDPSRGAGLAVDSRLIESTNEHTGVDTLAHPMPQMTSFVARGIAYGGP